MAERRNSDVDKETELTMCDVLEEEKELEDDANAVLGGSDDKNCSYDQGYVPRQALYACKSCSVNGFAGICLACCYACHDGHEVVELYTKRNFRCDCGNSKFTNSECVLNPNKNTDNCNNKYNQNFKGLYCVCSRPYPDLEDSIPDEMIQCVVCEDWYHGRHLGVEIPDDYFEMICGKCMNSHPFLFPYLSKYDPIIDVVETKDIQQLPVDSKNATESVDSKYGTEPVDFKNETKAVDSKNATESVDSKNGTEPVDIKNETEAVESKNGAFQPMEESSKVQELKCKDESLKAEEIKNGLLPVAKDQTSQLCVLKKFEEGNISIKRSGAAFWPENWRKELCHCSECMNMYRNAGCEFLLNLDDTIQSYEERGKGKENGESQYDKGLSALGQLDRVKQMEAIRAYTNMKGQLKEYLKEFADNKKTVRECDIKEFFERIGKKQKLNNGVPHFCR